MNDLSELGVKADDIGSGELAFEDGELEMVAEPAEDLESLVSALVVGDVVADQE